MGKIINKQSCHTTLIKLNKSFAGTVEIWEKAFVAARVQEKKYCMHGVEMLQS